MGHKPQKEKAEEERPKSRRVFRLGPESGEVFCSEAWKRLLGYGPERDRIKLRRVVGKLTRRRENGVERSGTSS